MAEMHVIRVRLPKEYVKLLDERIRTEHPNSNRSQLVREVMMDYLGPAPKTAFEKTEPAFERVERFNNA